MSRLAAQLMALGCLLMVVSVLAGGVAGSGEGDGAAPGRAGSLRARIARRHQAHPRATRVQLAALAASGAVELASLVCWLS